jgi:hypothetical protein
LEILERSSKKKGFLANTFICELDGNISMAKKKKKIKGRKRIFQRDQVFKKRAKIDLMVSKTAIVRAFPDPNEREAYIQALCHGLDTEPIVENK